MFSYTQVDCMDDCTTLNVIIRIQCVRSMERAVNILPREELAGYHVGGDDDDSVQINVTCNNPHIIQ